MLLIVLKTLLFARVFIVCIGSYWEKSDILPSNQITRCIFTSMNKCDSSFINANTDTIYLINSWLPSQKNTDNILVKDTVISYNNYTFFFVTKKPKFNSPSNIKIISYSINNDKIELQYLTLLNDKTIQFSFNKMFLIKGNTFQLVRRVDTC